jgi:chromosome partitioning protein
MRRIAVINQKGGVGKTTTTANLGAALAQGGQRVLLIDLDPQAHLSLHFGVELQDADASIYDVLASATPIREVSRQVRENVTLIAADVDLAGAEAELVSVTGREVLLREALEAVDADHDILLIDCPPSLGVLTINALVAVDEIIIPLQAHFLALQGLSRLLNTVTLVRQRINPQLVVSGIVLCMHESTTRLAGEVVDDLTGFLKTARGADTPWSDARLFSTYIRRNIKLAESASFGQTVFDYAPKSNGAADYARLALEVKGDLPDGRADADGHTTTSESPPGRSPENVEVDSGDNEKHSMRETYAPPARAKVVAVESPPASSPDISAPTVVGSVESSG